MAKVYSTQLFRASGLGGGSTSIGGPAAGAVWVMRNMSALYNGDPSSPLDGFTVQHASGETLWSVGPLAVCGFFAYQWAGRQVISPEETCSFNSDDGSEWELFVSGYLLELP